MFYDGAPPLYCKEHLANMLEHIKDLFRKTPKKLILSFIGIHENKHIGISHTGNQILVCMKSGEFRLFQPGVVTKDIDKILGASRSNVRYWTVLPTRKSQQHPLYDQNKEYAKDKRYEDIYV